MRAHSLKPHGGAALLEMALALPVFLLMLLCAMELSRALFVFTAVQEATRQAGRLASVTRFNDAQAMAQVRTQAMFGGVLPLHGDVVAADLRIDYLSMNAAKALVDVDLADPLVTPENNMQTCRNNPADARCIRFVRVRLCQQGAGPCLPVPYAPLIGFAGRLFPALALPVATTLTPAESLGLHLPCTTC